MFSDDRVSEGKGCSAGELERGKEVDSGWVVAVIGVTGLLLGDERPADLDWLELSDAMKIEYGIKVKKKKDGHSKVKKVGWVTMEKKSGVGQSLACRLMLSLKHFILQDKITKIYRKTIRASRRMCSIQLL